MLFKEDGWGKKHAYIPMGIKKLNRNTKGNQKYTKISDQEIKRFEVLLTSLIRLDADCPFKL